PPGVALVTVMAAAPSSASRVDGTTTWSSVAPAAATASAVPFHFTTEAGRKPGPVRGTRVVALPSGRDAGLTPVMTGAGWLTTSASEPDTLAAKVPSPT